jgi:queuine tRNA-ribosyltransferase
MLLSWHNVAFFQAMMQAMRTAINEGRFAAWRYEMRGRWLAQPEEPSPA